MALFIPYKFATPWASGAVPPYVTPVIPISAAGAPEGATQQQGYPPITGTNPSAGGIPPQMADWNGAMYYCTAWLQYLQAGAPIGWDGTLASNIGGYPAGALVRQAGDNSLFWLNSSGTNNSTNPDGGGSGWIRWPPAPPAASSISIFGTTGSVTNVTNLTMNSTTITGSAGVATATPISLLTVGTTPRVVNLTFSGATVSSSGAGNALVTIAAGSNLTLLGGNGGTATNVNTILFDGATVVSSFGLAEVSGNTLRVIQNGGTTFNGISIINFINCTVTSPSTGQVNVTALGGGGPVVPTLGGLYTYLTALTASVASDGHNGIFPGPNPGATRSGLQEQQGYSAFDPPSAVGPVYPGTWLCMGPTTWAMPGGNQGFSELTDPPLDQPNLDHWYQVTWTTWARIA